MPSVTSKKLAYIAAVQFKESFYEPAPEIGYVFIGNHLPYVDENNPTTTVDSISDEKLVWDNMYAAKKITGNDVELVIPKVTWTSNTKYKQYDDKLALASLLSSNTSLNVKPMYVYTSQRNVYKCLSNNNSTPSTVEPTGDYTSSNGNIATSDGYIWKYMFNVKPSNRFLTDDWIPVPTNTSQLDYGVNLIDVVDGELTTIVVTNPGSGYYHTDARVIPAFNTGCTVLQLANTTGIKANMSVSGTGIASGTYIQDVYAINTSILLSTATVSSGGGNTSANQLSITTRVYVDGDGTAIVATPVLGNTADPSSNIYKITVSTIGIGYSRANAYIYGTSNTATARCILDMKYGHAANPAKELGASAVMVASRIGEIDSTENGKIPVGTTFRQYGILVNPHKYGEANVVTSVNAGSVISQTTDISVVTGSSYTLDEFVYQGIDANTATAYGYLIDQTSNQIRLTNVNGIFKTGAAIKGANSGVSRLVINVGTPEFQPYSGDILYTENATKTTRADGQAENIKLIVRF